MTEVALLGRSQCMYNKLRGSFGGSFECERKETPRKSQQRNFLKASSHAFYCAIRDRDLQPRPSHCHRPAPSVLPGPSCACWCCGGPPQVLTSLAHGSSTNASLKSPSTSCLLLMPMQIARILLANSNGVSFQASTGRVAVSRAQIRDNAVSCNIISCNLLGCILASSPLYVVRAC